MNLQSGTLLKNIEAAIKAQQDLLADKSLLKNFDDVVTYVVSCYQSGGRLFLSENGGSAAGTYTL